MKVIIDLIEDIRTAINNNTAFSLTAMQLTESADGEFIPAGESKVCHYELDDEQKKLYFVLGKKQAVETGDLLEALNALSNEKMMYEVTVAYGNPDQRIVKPLIGFGEAFEDKKYLLFISDR